MPAEGLKEPCGVAYGSTLLEAYERAFSTDTESVQLRPEDFLLVYTDGITELRNGRDAMFGDERLSQIIREDRGVGPSLFAKGLIDELGRWANAAGDGAVFDDDLTFVALEVVAD